MSDKKNIVRVTGVTKNFDLGKLVVEVLKGIDLEIETGKYISIMGPSGSGKSTLFNMIGGLDKPTEGKVFIDEVGVITLNARPAGSVYRVTAEVKVKFEPPIVKMDLLDKKAVRPNLAGSGSVAMSSIAFMKRATYC